jgi:hypothetical protein
VDVTSPAYAEVIADDPFCCNTAWDVACQQAYDDLIGGGTGYCDAGADGTGLGLDERIINVTLSDIDNDSPDLAPVAPAYQDFTSVVGTVEVGGSYPISIGVSSSIGTSYNTNQVLVWIDLNGDEDFDDAGELVFVSDIGAVPAYTGTITIPAGTPAGTTRMRIRLHDTHDGSSYINNFNDTPCGLASYGEVEDYTLVITEAGGGCAVVPPAGVDVTSLAYAAVIATNPACCDVAWDGACQQAYDDLTGGGTGYCDAGADGTGLGLDERIINVTVADIDNDSPDAAPVAPAYQDFTSVVGTVLVGESYPISIGVNSSIGTTYNTNQVLVWIDLNGDEDFDDAGELVFVSDIGAVSEYTGTITIPAGTPAGTTRMRVRLHDTYVGVDYVNNLNDTPCGIASYGEVEDYTLVIDLSTSAQEVADVAWNVFPNPNNGDFTIRAQNVNGPVMLEVFDMAARLVHTARPVVTAGEDVQVALRGGVAPGTYLLRMTTADGRYEQRIVVQ